MAIPMLLQIPNWYPWLQLCAFLWFLSWSIWFIKRRYKWAILSSLAILILSLYLLVTDTARNYHLGEQIAYEYVAEAPAYEELRVYKNGVCAIGWGGIFGIHERFYLNYQTDRDTFWIKTDVNSSELFYYGRVNLNNKEYPIRNIGKK